MGIQLYNIGDRIAGRYEIHRILGGEGKSGMGVVYVCYDHEFKEVLALKTFQNKFLTSKRQKDNFKKEALLWTHLERHPYIVKAKWVQELDYRMFVGCEFIAPDDEGKNTLTHYLARPISLKQALTWSIQFCHAMEHASLKGVTPHRDIKPENIMITRDGVVKVTDFGLSGLWQGEDIADGLINEDRKGFTFIKAVGDKVIAGTPPWMAPEQFDGETDIRSDIYSFGIVIYQMINNGRLPFYPKAGDNWEEAHKTHPVLSLQAPKHRDEAILKLSPTIERCLRKRTEERYRDFKELRESLEELYEEVTGESPPSPPEPGMIESWERVNKGFSLANLGLFDEAIKEFSEAIRINPEDTAAHTNLGNALYNKGLFDEAIKEYSEAIRINPEYAEALNNLGNALAGKGLFDEAIKEYSEAIRINPEDTEAHYNLGNALYNKGLFDEAIKEYREAIRINPEDAEAHYNLGNAFKDKGLIDETIKEYSEALRINPEDAAAHTNLGLALYYKGLFDEAIKEYSEAIRINPEYAETHYNLGLALKDKGLLNEAIEAFENFKRYAPPQYAGHVEKVEDVIRQLKG